MDKKPKRIVINDFFFVYLASKQQAGEIFKRMKISTLVQLVSLIDYLKKNSI